MYLDARNYLGHIRLLRSNIRNLRKALDEIDAVLGVSAITYDSAQVISSPRKDGLENEAIKHLERRKDTAKELEETITEYTRCIAEATGYINQIESLDQREVLMLRYVECKTWSEILDIKECDDITSQCKLRDRAIKSFQEILDKNIT